jgi:hypothetical protein
VCTPAHLNHVPEGEAAVYVIDVSLLISGVPDRPLVPTWKRALELSSAASSMASVRRTASSIASAAAAGYVSFSRLTTCTKQVVSQHALHFKPTLR